MIQLDGLELLLLALGAVIGLATGRFLWERRATAISPWLAIAAVAVGALITSRLFDLLGIGALWQPFFFPLLVGWGAGLSVTRARPPLRSRWWEVWRV
jgi:hypothetical protein